MSYIWWCSICRPCITYTSGSILAPAPRFATTLYLASTLHFTTVLHSANSYNPQSSCVDSQLERCFLIGIIRKLAVLRPLKSVAVLVGSERSTSPRYKDLPTPAKTPLYFAKALHFAMARQSASFLEFR